jgi:hypothetical protein
VGVAVLPCAFPVHPRRRDWWDMGGDESASLVTYILVHFFPFNHSGKPHFFILTFH